MSVAREALEAHHEAYRLYIATAAAAGWSRDDEHFALFPVRDKNKIGEAAKAFVDACMKPTVPSTAVGVTTGDFDFDTNFEWSEVADREDVAAARALAQTAMSNQVLLTGEAAEMAGVDPEEDSERSERQLYGLRQHVTLVVAPWGDETQQRILNLPKLRPELKLLENATSDLLIASDEVREALSAFARSRIDSNLLRVRNLFHRVVVRVEDMATDVRHNRSELKHVRKIQGLVSELQVLCQELPRACDRVSEQLAADATATADLDLSGAWDEVLQVLRELHLDADKLIMDIDDGVAVGQPPALRY